MVMTTFPGVAFCEIADGLGGLAQRVGPAGDRHDLAGFQEPGQAKQVILVRHHPDRVNPLGTTSDSRSHLSL
jgi:hypothetical protein